MKTPLKTTSIRRLSVRHGFILVTLILASFALLPTGRAQLPSPSPDGGYRGNNTPEGDGALSSVRINPVFGNGIDNTAIGFNALFSNTTGGSNTATGREALFSSTTGFNNTANGDFALHSNTTGNGNTAAGVSALVFNRNGSDNTATGLAALERNTTGIQNTATGVAALVNNTTGRNNIALGFNAGGNLTAGNNNIDIGNVGVAGEAAKIRIGTVGTQKATFYRWH